MREVASTRAATWARSSGSPGSSVRKNQFPPQATSPVTRPSPGTSTATSRAWQKAGTFSMVTAPSGSRVAPTVPTGVSIRTGPGARRPRCSSVRATPMRPWPHMPRPPALLKKTTPAADPGSTGGVSSAPTIASWPRGSQTTAWRNRSWCLRRTPPLRHRPAVGLRPALDHHPRGLALRVRVHHLHPLPAGKARGHSEGLGEGPFISWSFGPVLLTSEELRLARRRGIRRPAGAEHGRFLGTRPAGVPRTDKFINRSSDRSPGRCFVIPEPHRSPGRCFVIPRSPTVRGPMLCHPEEPHRSPGRCFVIPRSPIVRRADALSSRGAPPFAGRRGIRNPADPSGPGAEPAPRDDRPPTPFPG